MGRQQTAVVERVTAEDAGESDEALIVSVARADREAFALLFDRHGDRAYGFASRLLNRAEAEDAVQDAFLRIWTDAGRWQADRGRFAPWFYRILYNLCIDRLRRKQGVGLDVVAEMATAEPGPEELVTDVFRGERVAAALERLPARQKTAVLLCYYQGLSNREAAEVMDVGVKGLEALLVRARRQLAVDLVEDRPPGSGAEL